MSASALRPTWAQRKFAFVHPPWMLADFVERLRGVVPRLRPLLEGLPESDAHREIEGKWSVAQNIGHLADVEELWQERLEDLRQGKEAYTAAVGARFQELAKRHQERPVETILAELEDRRSQLVDALARAPAELQEAAAFHERLQVPMRLVDCAQFYAEHDDHHLLRIRTIRSILGGDAAAATRLPGLLTVAPQFTVPDVVAAATYYREVLGFENRGFFGTPPVFAMLGRGGVEIFFNQSADVTGRVRPRAAVGYDAYIHITGVDLLFGELRGRSAKIIEGPIDRVYGMRELIVEDCHGLRLAFGEDPGPQSSGQREG